MNAVESDVAGNRTVAYSEVCHSYERIDDFRSKLLGLLPLVSGTGLFFLLRSPPGGSDSRSDELITLAGVFGILVTVGLLFYELRGIQRCNRLAAVGADLERQMGVEGRFTRWPTSVGHFINEPVAAGFIYPAVLGSWTFLVARNASFAAAAFGSVVVFAVGFAGVYAFYRHVKET